MTTPASRNSILFTSFTSQSETEQPTSATGITNGILKRRSAAGRLYLNQMTAAHVETYCRITTRFARLTRLLKLKPRAAKPVKTVVITMASDGVLKRG